MDSHDERMGSDLLPDLLPIERRLWSNDAEFYRATLMDEAVLVFAETGRITREAAVAAIERENAAGHRWADVLLENARCVSIANTVALLTYRAVSRWEHERDFRSAIGSSVYVNCLGEWKLAFHQQTPR